jgi:hypothetical protein
VRERDAKATVLAPTSRREFLRAAGGAAGFAALAPLLAACAAGEEGAPAERERVVHVANWPLYLDRERRPDGSFTRPSLELFTEETGIGVNYREVIPDAEEFFRDIQGWLAAGEHTGRDVMVITNGLTLTKLIELDYLEPLPFDGRPNFAQHASELVTDPSYDPGNRFMMAWQSGITGIAYDRRRTKRRIKHLSDLFDAEFEGRVGMFGDLVDLPNLAILAIGADPETSTPDDWKDAAKLLRRQRDRGIVRAYYTQLHQRAREGGCGDRDGVVGRHLPGEGGGRRAPGVRPARRRRAAVDRRDVRPQGSRARRRRPAVHGLRLSPRRGRHDRDVGQLRVGGAGGRRDHRRPGDHGAHPDEQAFLQGLSASRSCSRAPTMRPGCPPIASCAATTSSPAGTSCSASSPGRDFVKTFTSCPRNTV